ncbi:MAG: HupE/UreJ family protein [Holophagales bacterium]|nr:HupE/UreJ family protein [Holophagales bacterium]
MIRYQGWMSPVHLRNLPESAWVKPPITWRTPVARIPGSPVVRPELPCPALPLLTTAEGDPQSASTADIAASLGLPRVATTTTTADSRTWIHRWRLDCGGQGLAGREITIQGLGSQSPEVLLRWADAQGRSEQRVLDILEPSVVLPAQPSEFSVLRSYLVLGVEHILGGFDHLAFVLALVLLVSGAWRLVWTLTAFTLGHSLTLALVVLDAVRIPSTFVEIAIAASILVLAVELAGRGRASTPDPSQDPEAARPEGAFARRPWLMAGAFGLLHGCGFAGALRELGLPQGEVPLSLLSFNVGIELGQILFVLVLWGLAWVAARVVGYASASGDGEAQSPAHLHERPAWRLAETLVVYLLGTLAAYWTLERLVSLYL